MSKNSRKNRKRLSGRKVTRKPKKSAALRIRAAINNQKKVDLSKFYDETKSVAQNLTNMGLDCDVNNTKMKLGVKVANDNNSVESANKNKAFLGFTSIPQSEFGKDINVKRRIMSEVDQLYAKKLIEKYDTEYKKMERDIKLNYNQLTETACKKWCEKYKSLDSKQKLV